METDVAKDSPEDAVKSFRYSDGFVASIAREVYRVLISSDAHTSPTGPGDEAHIASGSSAA